MQENELIPWLLNARTPSIRYQTLVDLLGYPADDQRVVEARRAIAASGPVPAILSRQSKTGNWSGERSYYTPKYVSTQWSMMLLAELSVDADDPGFQQGVRYMLAATATQLSERLDTHTLGFSCFWGNLLRYALHAGKLGDAQVGKVIHYSAFDLQDGSCRCVHNTGYACAWGVVRTLWGLAAIPKAQRTPEVNTAIEQGAKFLLDSFQLIKADYPTPDGGSVNPLWFKLNFPLFYQTDILFTLRVLDELDLLDHPGAQAALDWLEARRAGDGRWSGSSPYRPRTWRELGDREETGRWVSLQAARVLQHAGRIAVPAAA